MAMTQEQIDAELRDAANRLLKADVPPEVVCDALMALAIGLGVKVAGPLHVAEQLHVNAKRLLEQAEAIDRGDHQTTAPETRH